MDAISIRSATADDGEAVAAIYAPFVSDTIVSFELEPPTGREMAERIAATQPTHPYLVAQRNGEVIGYAYAGAHRARAAYSRSVDVSIYLAAGARRQGVGRILYGALFEQLAKADFHMAFAGIALPNDASIGLHKAMGFAPVGIYREVGFKFGAWHNTSWWQKRL